MHHTVYHRITWSFDNFDVYTARETYGEFIEKVVKKFSSIMNES